MQKRCSGCGLVFRFVLVIIVFNCSQGTATCIAGASKPEFKYRWVGSDQWAAEHGCNVNIPEAFQKPGQPYYQIWGGYHTLDRLLPADKYFKAHPEYFSLYNNQRTPYQLCLSNPYVQKIVADNLIQIIRDHPRLDILTIGPQDNRMFCQCPDCRAQDEKKPAPDQRYSRRVLLFYKNVSERVHLTFPEIIIRFGCYDVYAAPPKDQSIILPLNTYPLICHYQKYCLNHPIYDNRCLPNKRFRKIVGDWRKRTDKLFIYEYYYKVNWLDLPWPIVHSILDDIGWYQHKGVVGFYSQYNPDSAGSLLNFHVATALLQNVDANSDQLIDAFCKDQFGSAWKEMKAYFNVLETAMINSGLHIPDRGFAFPHAVHVFTDEVILRCKELVGAAKAKATRSPFKENVEKYEKLMAYTRRCVEFLRVAVKALGEQGMLDDAGEVDQETVFAALEKGNALVRYIQENREELKGVIPSRKTVNPYLDSILRKLGERCEGTKPRSADSAD